MICPCFLVYAYSLMLHRGISDHKRTNGLTYCLQYQTKTKEIINNAATGFCSEFCQENMVYTEGISKHVNKKMRENWLLECILREQNLSPSFVR